MTTQTFRVSFSDDGMQGAELITSPGSMVSIDLFDNDNAYILGLYAVEARELADALIRASEISEAIDNRR